MISFSELAKKLTEGVMQPNGTDKVDYDKGMDGNPQNPDKKNKKSRGSDIKILNGEQEPPIKEDKSYIEQHLADKDINASVSGNTVKVHSSDVAATKKHLAKAGYNHKVVGGLNEAMYVEQSRAESGELFKSLVDRAHASSKAGNHTQAKRHLANAQTARYGITSGNMAKHKASFDKYKELKNSYTNSDDHVREDISIDEDLQPHQLKQIHKEYQYHKSRSTADVLKTHKGMHRVQSQNYTAGEMGGKEGLISDIMQHKHGKTRMTAYHALPSAQKKALSETEAVMPSYTKEETINEISQETKSSYVSKAIQNILDRRAKEKASLVNPKRKNYPEYKAHVKKTDDRESTVNKLTKEETLDEISKDTLRSYANKAFAHGNDLHYDIDHTSDKDEKAKLRAKLSKRNDGVIKASQKLRKEDMDEAVSTVKKDASGKVIAWSHEGDWEKMSGKKQGQGKAANLAGKALQQTKKLTKEEKDEGEYGYEGDMAISQLKTICRHAEHLMGMLKPDTDLPEWVQSKITLATDYMQTAHDYMMSEMNESLNEAAHVYDTKTGKVHSTHDTYRKAINAMNKLNDKHPGYDTPGGLVQSKFGAKRVSEDVDLEEKRGLWDNIHAKRKRIAAGSGEKMRKPGSKGAPSAQDLKDAQVKEDINESAWGRDKMTSLRQAHDRHMEKALAANKAGDDVAVKTHQRKMQMIQGKMQKLKQNEEVELGEECEILSELSKKTLGSYVKKAALSQHYDNKNFNSKETNNKDTQSNDEKIAGVKKSSKRTMGVMNAVNRLTKEEVEDFMQTEEYDQLDELSKDTLKSYVGKASKNARIQGMMQTDYAHRSKKAKSSGMKNAWDKMSRDAMKTGWKREDGIKTAVNKLTKEDNMLTYSEFMAQLLEGRADDLKDKLAADREARLNNYDYSKEKAAKKSPVQKVKGHSYGAGEEEGEDDEGSTKTVKPASEKRGRGRPAGSKSGARV
jgi:hypothetical protein